MAPEPLALSTPDQLVRRCTERLVGVSTLRQAGLVVLLEIERPLGRIQSFSAYGTVTGAAGPLYADPDGRSPVHRHGFYATAKESFTTCAISYRETR